MPTLKLVSTGKAPKRRQAMSGGPPEDVRAWGIVFDAVDEGLRLDLSPAVRRRLVRFRALIGHLARRPLVGKAGGA